MLLARHLSLTTFVLAVVSVKPARAQSTEYVAVVLDTGSAMRQQNSSTRTKWQVAKWRTRQFLGLVTNPDSRMVSLFTYSDAVRQLTDFQAPTRVRSVLDALADPSADNVGSPVSGALCTAVDALAQATRGASAKTRIFLASSGEDDELDALSACSGATSGADYPAFEADSWQAKTRNKLRSGSATDASVSSFLSLVDAEAYRTFGASSDERGAVEQFLLGVSGESGGQPRVIDASDVLPRFGDTNEDGCVDVQDTDERALWMGEDLDPTHPLLLRLDTNRDGQLNNLDALSAVTNSGCAGP